MKEKNLKLYHNNDVVKLSNFIVSTLRMVRRFKKKYALAFLKNSFNIVLGLEKVSNDLRTKLN